jgi:hypothetical protein
MLYVTAQQVELGLPEAIPPAMAAAAEMSLHAYAPPTPLHSTHERGADSVPPSPQPQQRNPRHAATSFVQSVVRALPGLLSQELAKARIARRPAASPPAWHATPQGELFCSCTLPPELWAALRRAQAPFSAAAGGVEALSPASASRRRSQPGRGQVAVVLICPWHWVRRLHNRCLVSDTVQPAGGVVEAVSAVKGGIEGLQSHGDGGDDGNSDNGRTSHGDGVDGVWGIGAGAALHIRLLRRQGYIVVPVLLPPLDHLAAVEFSERWLRGRVCASLAAAGLLPAANSPEGQHV